MLTKPRDPSKMLQQSVARRKRRFSPLMIAGISVPVVLALIAGAVFVIPRLSSHAAAPNPNCTLIVPQNPLSAQGLATPYQLVGTNAAQDGPCNEANTAQSAFVQATIYNPADGTFSVYTPLVIDQGTQPAVAPTPPTLPANATVGLWFGFNGTNLTLQGTGRRFSNSLAQGRCLNGLPGSVFGQFATCNGPRFFQVVNQAIQNGTVTVPALGTANDGLPCPTNRDFSVIDQDQSDNVQTQYLATANGQIAQMSAANQAQLAGATTIGNPSDNALISNIVDPALGCTPWTAPNLTDNGTPTASLALDELLAAADQQAPVALVPLNDPMTLNNNNSSLWKTDLYRLGVDQPLAFNNADASGTTYCMNEFTSADPNTGLIRLANDSQQFFGNVASPMADAASNLATFLAMRANQSFTNLGCQNLLNVQDPVNLVTDANGVVIGATFTLGNGQTVTIGQAAAAPTPTAAAGNGGAGAATPTPTAATGNGGAGAATPTPTPAAGATGGAGAATPTPTAAPNQ
jgi:hypothetical protein